MKAKQAYAEWCLVFPHLPKPIRAGIGARIENCFLDITEYIFIAWYAPLEKKILLVEKARERLDVLKLFLTIAWENKGLSVGFYSSLVEKLCEVGRMSYRWRESLTEKLPQSAGENK